MDIGEVIENQNLRLELLVKLYEESDGLETYSFQNVGAIQRIFPKSADQLISALLFLFEEGYISYFDASTQAGRDMARIRLKSKGIKLAEAILLQANVAQFESDFASQTFNYFYHIHDIDKTNVIIGNNNQQS